jgi:hypothetical protein
MPQLDTITPEEASARLLVAFRRSGDGTFLEALQRPFLNPVEQRDEKGRRKLHSLLVVGIVLGILAAISVAVFGFHLWGA